MEKTTIHCLNFPSLKSEVNFILNFSGAQARNDLASMPSFTLQKMIPFKDTVKKHQLLPALQYFWEEKRAADSNLVTVAPFEQTVIIFMSKRQLEQVPETPETGWTGKEITAVVSVLYISVFSEGLFALMHLDAWGPLRSKTAFSLIIHSETGVIGSNSVHWPDGADDLCPPSVALPPVYPLCLFYPLFAQSRTALYTEQ